RAGAHEPCAALPGRRRAGDRLHRLPVRAWPQLIASYIDAPFTALGTDGFGRSDTRAALRRFFEIDRHHVVLAALTALRDRGQVDAKTCAEAIARYGPVNLSPVCRWRAE